MATEMQKVGFLFFCLIISNNIFQFYHLLFLVEIVYDFLFHLPFYIKYKHFILFSLKDEWKFCNNISFLCLKLYYNILIWFINIFHCKIIIMYDNSLWNILGFITLIYCSKHWIINSEQYRDLSFIYPFHNTNSVVSKCHYITLLQFSLFIRDDAFFLYFHCWYLFSKYLCNRIYSCFLQ